MEKGRGESEEEEDRYGSGRWGGLKSKADTRRASGRQGEKTERYSIIEIQLAGHLDAVLEAGREGKGLGI